MIDFKSMPSWTISQSGLSDKEKNICFEFELAEKYRVLPHCTQFFDMFDRDVSRIVDFFQSRETAYAETNRRMSQFVVET